MVWSPEAGGEGQDLVDDLVQVAHLGGRRSSSRRWGAVGACRSQRASCSS